MNRLRNEPRSDYEVVKITGRVIWIADLCREGTRSVTNDAERVVAEVDFRYPNRRIIYRDTDGNWDELKHDGSVFRGFAPAREMLPERYDEKGVKL